MEECGLEVRIKKFEFFNERFFYFNNRDLAWQVYGFVYRCEADPNTQTVAKQPDELDGDSTWVEISSLKEEDFHILGKEIIAALKNN